MHRPTDAESPDAGFAFADLPLSDRLLRSLHAIGRLRGARWQRDAVLAALAGHDVLLQAPIGRMRTLALTLPLLDRACHEPGYGIVVVPTAERAEALRAEISRIAGPTGVRIGRADEPGSLLILKADEATEVWRPRLGVVLDGVDEMDVSPALCDDLPPGRFAAGSVQAIEAPLGRACRPVQAPFTPVAAPPPQAAVAQDVSEPVSVPWRIAELLLLDPPSETLVVLTEAGAAARTAWALCAAGLDAARGRPGEPRDARVIVADGPADDQLGTLRPRTVFRLGGAAVDPAPRVGRDTRVVDLPEPYTLDPVDRAPAASIGDVVGAALLASGSAPPLLLEAARALLTRPDADRIVAAALGALLREDRAIRRLCGQLADISAVGADTQSRRRRRRRREDPAA